MKLNNFTDLDVILPKYEKGQKAKVSCPTCRSDISTYLTYIHGSLKYKYEATFCQLCDALWLTAEQLTKKLRR